MVLLDPTTVPVIKMTFKLSTIFFMAQAILLAVAMPPDLITSSNSTEMAADAYGCFKKGELWRDLGTNESIIAAYDQQWCKNAVGLWTLGTKVECAAGSSIAWLSANSFTVKSLHSR